MSNGTIRKITRGDVEGVLVRMETGQTTVEDANLVRAYLRMLDSWLAVYVGTEKVNGAGTEGDDGRDQG